jgi:hypothetical protein
MNEMLSPAVSDFGNKFIKLKQDEKTFNAYKPYFEQQGINTDALNPAMGGSGFGDITPLKMLEMQQNNALKQLQAMSYMSRINKNNQSPTEKALDPNKFMTRKTLMQDNPALADEYRKKYDFSNGKNQDFLNQELPIDYAKMLMPKQKSVIEYKGGTNSKKTSSGHSIIEHKSNGGKSKPKTKDPLGLFM